jgi:hypothetical protein
MAEKQKAQMVEGVVAFSNLTKHDVYEGKDTGNFTLTLTMDAKAASLLEDNGVKVKDYEGKAQRKFKSQYAVDMIDAESEPVANRELPFGTTVRVLFVFGTAHPEHGVPVYMNKIRVLEMAAPEAPDEF